jgi:hypothetical protein
LVSFLTLTGFLATLGAFLTAFFFATFLGVTLTGAFFLIFAFFKGGGETSSTV